MKRTQILSAATALLFVATAAQAQRGQDDRRGHQDQRVQASPQDQQRHGGDSRGAEPQRPGVDRARDDQAHAEQGRAEQARAAEEQNQRRSAQQSEPWRDQQNRQAQQQEQLERAQRAEQQAQLEQREGQVQVNRAYDRYRDDQPGFDVRSEYGYRYNIGGVYRETNQYGADALRQAVDQGYEQGYRAGSIDRREGAPSDFRRAFDFENGDYGYTGAYVPLSDYSYYFREGFQRGYDDGYWNRSQYGTFSNGRAAILGGIALGILGLTMIH